MAKNEEGDGSKKDLETILSHAHPSTSPDVLPLVNLQPYTWKEIRLFLSSSFIDTHAERDALIKNVIPNLNREFASRFIRIVPVDLRWGVSKDESCDCFAIQKTCLNALDACRLEKNQYAWFLGLRTERYGWVQDQLMTRDGFENSDKFDWVDTLKKYEKELSITSLECIHATHPLLTQGSAPTIFFYKRQITNYENVESDLKWVFDFEYVPVDAELDPEVQYQYVKTEKAQMYRNDRNSLDSYLKGLKHVKYSTYDCQYEKGNAMYTCKNEGRKSFGVGYVSDLDQFEEKVEADLSEAINDYFSVPDVEDLGQYELDSIQHENAIQGKAANFVGRSDLTDVIWEFCEKYEPLEYGGDKNYRRYLTDVILKFFKKYSTSEAQRNSLMIIHGEPGCGKSAILAKISNRCINELRDEGHFVFVHAVDSCPRSNSLERMLRRLHTNLRKYVKNLKGEKGGEDDECNDQLATLKKEHVTMLEVTAVSHSEKLFVILIDAVNQFQESLQAWNMWWLPSKDAPPNLHFVISTLNEENGTFKNACELHKHARKVEVRQMNHVDAETMVSKTLGKYNKKLTTEDDWLLGNQMATLLSKSMSPLYLNASIQALRCFGIFEKLSEYIRQLPSNVKDLFIFLIKEWSEEYGEQFIKDVMGMLALSRDGLLENEINDILSYNESKNNFSYNCSFSRLYDSICGFLAAGGGGFLRFFHDQLKNVVKEKVIPTAEDKEAIHVTFVDFYINCIQAQLCESPRTKPPSYYAHCLQQIVRHQISAMVTSGEERGYAKTLRNIFFVRERCVNDQNTMLQDEYVDAIQASTDDKETIALKQWSKFSQIYSSYIKRFPKWTLNMALNQSSTSYVSMDTRALNVVPLTHGEYPYYWTNAPSEGDYLALKYTLEDTKCCTSSQEKNLCAVSMIQRALIMEADTGSVIHHISLDTADHRITAMHFSTKLNTFWTGTTDLNVIVWNIDTGTEEWRTRPCRVRALPQGKSVTEAVRWIENIGDYMAVGMGPEYNRRKTPGNIQLYDEETHQIIKQWDIEDNTHSYCYSPVLNVIVSAHDRSVKLWDFEGSLLNEFFVDETEKTEELGAANLSDSLGLDSLSAHPTDEIILVSKYGNVRQLDATTGNVVNKFLASIENVMYSQDGEKIIGFNWCNIIVYSREGVLLNKIQGHSTQINEIRLGAGHDDIITAALDGSYSMFIPQESDQKLDSATVSHDIFVNYCELVCHGKYYVTLDRDAVFALWDASTQEQLKSVKYEFTDYLVASLTGQYIVSYPGQQELHFYDVETLERVMEYDIGDSINDLKLSVDGLKCICATNKDIQIIDISDVMELRQIASFDIEAHVVDLHQDDETIVAITIHAIMLLNINSGETIAEFGYVELATYVRFLYNPNRILYGDDQSLFVVDMEGNNEIKLKCTMNLFVLLKTLSDGQALMTSESDNSISFHDLTSGEVLYTFVDHRSTRFTAFHVYPDDKSILAFNRNGIKYVLEK